MQRYHSVESRSSMGGTAKQAVTDQINAVEQRYRHCIFVSKNNKTQHAELNKIQSGGYRDIHDIRVNMLSGGQRC